MDQNIIRDLLKETTSLLIRDTHTYFGWGSCKTDVCMRSWLIVPFKTGDEIIGFYTLSKSEPLSFDPGDVYLADALVSQAAVAVQNAWLYEQVRSSHERLQFLSHSLVRAQEIERSYIARELHDEIGQSLASLMIDLELLERSADQPRAVMEGAAGMQARIGDIMRNLHNIAMDLRPASLDHLGLIPAIRLYVRTFQERYGVQANFEAFGLNVRLPYEMEIGLYRIMQEALANIVRHAQASHVDLLIEHHHGELILVIEDDGLGFDPNSGVDAGQSGLTGIQERVKMLGGNLIVDSRVGTGTTIKVEIPWEY